MIFTRFVLLGILYCRIRNFFKFTFVLTVTVIHWCQPYNAVLIGLFLSKEVSQVTVFVRICQYQLLLWHKTNCVLSFFMKLLLINYKRIKPNFVFYKFKTCNRKMFIWHDVLLILIPMAAINYNIMKTQPFVKLHKLNYRK